MRSNSISPGGSARGTVLGYAVALLSIAAASVHIAFIDASAPVSTFVLAVIVSAWVGGTNAGLFAITLSLFALAYYLPPGDSFAIDPGQAPRFAYFLAIACFLVWLIGSERRAAEIVRRASGEVERQNTALRAEQVEARTLADELRLNENRLRLVIDTIPAMAWICEPDGRLEFLNRRWLDYSGLSMEEAIANPGATMHPEDSLRAFEEWRRLVVTHGSYEQEIRLRRADGEYRWFLVRTVALLDDNGEVVKWYGMSTDIEDRKRAEHALRESADRLQYLSHRLMAVQEEERRNLSRELHDEFGQLLATIKLHVHAARRMTGESAHPSLDESVALLQRAAEQVRSLALELRPTILETAGLDGTLRWLASQHRQRTGIEIEVVGQLGDVAGDLAIACFRVAQQALTNVVQHANARNIWIELAQDENGLEMVIRDDGIGFDVATMLAHGPGWGHLGLLGMRERVQFLGGNLRVDSQPGQGTRLRVSFGAGVMQLNGA